MNPGFITLTNVFDRSRITPVYIKVADIQAVCRSEERGMSHYTVVQIPAHPNGGWRVAETPEEIFQLMAAGAAPRRLTPERVKEITQDIYLRDHMNGTYDLAIANAVQDELLGKEQP
jgi:hypothetical protein